MEENEEKDSQVADGALQNLQEAIQIGRTDVIVRTIDLATKHLSDGQAGLVRRVLNRPLANANTCLHQAVSLGHADAVRALLHAGADPAACNSSGKTPFQLAATDALQSPFSSHAMEAIAAGRLPAVKQILASGMHIDHSRAADQFNTLLHWACRYGNLSTVTFLLGCNARVDLANAEGFNALHEAVRRWNVPIVQYLVDNGANPTTTVSVGPQSGKSAMDLVPAPHSWSELQLTNNDGAMDHGPVPPLTSHTISSPRRVKAESPCPVSGEVSNDLALDSPLIKLWPPPALLHCRTTCPGFHLDETLSVMYHLGDSTEQFVRATDVLSNVQTVFMDLQVKISVSLLPPDGGLATGCLIFSINADFFTSAEAYNLTITRDRIHLQAADLPGLWYGLQTLIQIIQVHACEDGSRVLPALYIRDWPDLKYRGYMLDLMQGRLPTLDTLKWLVVTMSALKMNMLQLRMGASSFAYEGLEDLWCTETSYSKKDILMLNDFAKAHFVTLVPHQDSMAVARTVLSSSNPGENPAIEEISGVVVDLHRQLFSCFPESGFAHVGLDQPPGHSIPGAKQSLQDFDGLLWTLHSSCRLHRLYMQVWGSELQVRPSLMAELPASVIVMQPLGQFTQEGNSPFCSQLAQSGVSFFVCPDSLAKNSVSGRPHASMAQLVTIARCAARYKAMGMMLTDFADVGHLHPLVASTVPLVASAAVSWRCSTTVAHLEEQVPNVINQFVLMDESNVAGQLLLDLQLVHSSLLVPPSANSSSGSKSMPGHTRASSTLGAAAATPGYSGAAEHDAAGEEGLSASWWQPVIANLVLRPDTLVLPEVTSESVQAALREVRHCQAVLATLRLRCSQGTAILAEISFIVDFFMFVCRAIKQMVLSNCASGKASEAMAGLGLTARTDLANRLIGVTRLYGEAWGLRYLTAVPDKSSLPFHRCLSILQGAV